MASILYISVHEILEHDEMDLLYELGHTVFSLGVFSPLSDRQGNWRPRPRVMEHCVEPLKEEFVKINGAITREFVDLFDAVLVMHDLEFIQRNWEALKHKKVIWRTIGQGVDEQAAKRLKDEGLLVVGWSHAEAKQSSFIGRDAVIYSYKDARLYGPWTGQDGGILTFSNAYKQRYPHELEFFEASVKGLPYKLGGGMNEDIQNAIGLVDFADQISMYSTCGAYFYAHGSYIPYTLNFIESFITGAPVIAIGSKASFPGYPVSCNEIVDIIKHGENGFLVNTPAEAHDILKEVLNSPALAAKISRAGRNTAVEKFGKETALSAWKSFFHTIGIS